MDTLTAQLDQLQDRLENAAFLASQGNAREAHSEIFRCTAALSEIRRMCSLLAAGTKASGSETVEADPQDAEVRKVRTRLRLWATRQDQFNSRILNAYLSLEKLGAVTETALRRECSGFNFDSNFAQMKSIADRNHGKVFDHRGDVVTLWPPIEPYVQEYKKALKVGKP